MRRKVRILVPVLTRKTISRRPFSPSPPAANLQTRKENVCPRRCTTHRKENFGTHLFSHWSAERGVEQKHYPPTTYLLLKASCSTSLAEEIRAFMVPWRRDPLGELRTKSGIMHWQVLVSPCMR
ncbi:hypothetical protein TNIN_146431 [Trichonephila inaurata madagascariensis]|uniref:Uncharacterized protein n=1 Tax=Trichonephila inaurata madagascariensis TaxID=2747483 RepID=A0A8X7C5F5_9ARAC|nr:hypothetical protein TNIN_146431 [Trichonephila inaurata madagascariensis]